MSFSCEVAYLFPVKWAYSYEVAKQVLFYNLAQSQRYLTVLAIAEDAWDM